MTQIMPIKELRNTNDISDRCHARREPIDIPTEQDFRKSLDEAALWAKEEGYEESDVNDIIKSYRNSKRSL